MRKGNKEYYVQGIRYNENIFKGYTGTTFLITDTLFLMLIKNRPLFRGLYPCKLEYMENPVLQWQDRKDGFII